MAVAPRRVMEIFGVYSFFRVSPIDMTRTVDTIRNDMTPTYRVLRLRPPRGVTPPTPATRDPPQAAARPLDGPRGTHVSYLEIRGNRHRTSYNIGSLYRYRYRYRILFPPPVPSRVASSHAHVITDLADEMMQNRDDLSQCDDR